MLRILLILIITAGFLSTEQFAAAKEYESPRVVSTENLLVADAVEFLADELVPGSLIMHQGDCLAVKIYTRSQFTHVGIALPDEAGGWIVYDSANGEGVRKSTLEEYLSDCVPDELAVYHPASEYSEEELASLTSHLEGEQGRPYGVRHHLSGQRAEGVHCAEYVTDALMAAGVIHAYQPAKVSPASLLKGVTETQLYQSGTHFELHQDVIPAPPVGSWCERMWVDTTTCTSQCFRKMSRMVFCRD